MKNEIKLTGLENLLNKASLNEVNPFNTKFLSINKLEEHEFNEGRQNEENVELLKQSIINAGLLQPLLVYQTKDGKYKIISGHGRYRAIKQLKQYKFNGVIYDADEIPVIIDKDDRTDLEYKLNILRSNAQKDESVDEKIINVKKAETIYIKYRENGLLTEADQTNKRKWISEITGYSESSVREYLTKIYAHKSNSKDNKNSKKDIDPILKDLKKSIKDLEKVRIVLDETIDENTKVSYFDVYLNIKQLIKEFVSIIQR